MSLDVTRLLVSEDQGWTGGCLALNEVQKLILELAKSLRVDRSNVELMFHPWHLLGLGRALGTVT